MDFDHCFLENEHLLAIVNMICKLESFEIYPGQQDQRAEDGLRLAAHHHKCESGGPH